MKKLLSVSILFLLFFVLPTTVGAEKSKWKSNDYDFSVVRNVVIVETETNEPNINSYTSDAFSQNKIEAALRQAFEKRKIKVFTSADVTSGNGPISNVYLTITTKINALGKWSEQKEAYYETRTVYKKITVENSNGKTTTITVPSEETIYHPARTAWHAVVNLEFTVSSADGQKVYMVVDNRDRSEDTDTSGMLGRICNDLADDISRK
jgi:hypothetical protein